MPKFFIGFLLGFLGATILIGEVSLPQYRSIWMRDCVSIVNLVRNGPTSLKTDLKNSPILGDTLTVVTHKVV